jgi:hypothetical protein
MKIKLFLFCFAFLINVPAWASFYHYEHYALTTLPSDKNFASLNLDEPSSGLVISGAVDSDRSTNYFGAMNFVFENKSDRWIILKDVKISFPTLEQNENISIPIGDQFSAWAQGMQNLDDYNNKKALVLSSILGAVLAVKGDAPVAKSVGAFTTGYSLVSLAQAKNYNEILSELPPYHLLKGDIAIPPGLFMKRWILFNSKKHKSTGLVHTLILDFKDQDGQPQKYFLQFRGTKGPLSDNWQADDFGRVTARNPHHP